MRLHFAGSDMNPIYGKILTNCGAKNRLVSYYSIKNKSNISFDDLNYLLDSGGFVARTKNVVISVESYASFINSHKVKVAFNLDTNDALETDKNYKYLVEKTNSLIIPIFHYSDYLKDKGLLDKFINDYGCDYVSVGGIAGVSKDKALVKNFYSFVFSKTKDKIKVHGLGITSKKELELYPWYSVDSTSWLGAARYGSISNESKIMSKIKAKHQHYLKNTEQEVRHYLTIEDKITRLWKERGINWE